MPIDPPRRPEFEVDRIFFLQLEARSTERAEGSAGVGGGLVHAWVEAPDAEEAEQYVRAYVADYGWEPGAVTLRLEPTAAAIATLGHEEHALYASALLHGIGIGFMGYKAETDAEQGGGEEVQSEALHMVRPLTPKDDRDFWEYEGKRRRAFARKVCLHPDAAPSRCKRVILAHSVQRSAVLAPIAEAGHVYRISSDATTLRGTGGALAPALVGINKASTFHGLCSLHDERTFLPLEKRPFVGDPEQCGLLAYRAVLRELYAKQSAMVSAEALSGFARTRPAPRRRALERMVGDHALGVSRGLETVRWHKAQFDDMLMRNCWEDLRFALVVFDRVTDVVVTSAWYPIIDFDGNVLINAERLFGATEIPHLIAIATCAMGPGSSWVFAWHKDSDPTCNQFLASLIAVEPSRRGDALVRLAFSVSENLFLRPSWWDGLAAVDQTSLMDRMTRAASLTEPFRAEELIDDGVRLATWAPGRIALHVTYEDRVVPLVE